MTSHTGQNFGAENLSVLRGGKMLIEQLSLSIEPGEVVALLGPNGAGKSTLIKSLAGEFAIQTGQIHLNGRPLSNWSRQQRAQQVGVLPQQLDLTFPFTGLEVALFGRTPHRYQSTAARDRDIVWQALAAVDARHLAHRQYVQLSGGERARVQLARVLAQVWENNAGGPRYLLLDEPTSALDIAHQLQLMRNLRRIAAHKEIGILLILHDLNLAMGWTDRIALLRQGRLMATGTPEQIAEEDRIEQVFDVRPHIARHPLHQHPWMVF
jgi:iron complex transport system ATP-binding protein